MPTSLRYNNLVARITQLESHLLPAIDQTLNYSDKDRDLTRAFCLLCHAELEAYIEDITKEVVGRAFSKWKADKKIISPIIFHLAYNYKQENGKPKEAPYNMVFKSYNTLIETINKNNGIKENNLLGFFRPIGYEIDPTLQSTLNDYGKNRGDIAHTSFNTQQPLDPATEKNNIRQILNALATFDNELNDYEANGTLNRTPVNMSWSSRCQFLDKIKKWLKL
jgi:hypothetical protein